MFRPFVVLDKDFLNSGAIIQAEVEQLKKNSEDLESFHRTGG